VIGLLFLATLKTSGDPMDLGAFSGIPNARSMPPIPPGLYGFHAPTPLESLSLTNPMPHSRELPQRTLDPATDEPFHQRHI